MRDTQGLDALAALCGSTSAAAQTSTADEPRTGEFQHSSSAGSRQAGHELSHQASSRTALLPEVPPSVVGSNNNSGSASMTQNIQQQQAAAASPFSSLAYSWPQSSPQAAAQAYAQAAQQAASRAAVLPPSVLSAYLAAAGLPSGAAAGFSPAVHGHTALTVNSNAHAQAMAAQLVVAAQQQSGISHAHAQSVPAPAALPSSFSGQQQAQYAHTVAGVPGSAAYLDSQTMALMAARAPAATTSLGAVRNTPEVSASQHVQAASSPAPQTAPKHTPPSLNVPASSQSPVFHVMPPPHKAPSASQPNMSAATMIPQSRNVKHDSAAVSRQHTPGTVISEWEDKKQMKRAANRLSAHLSRKRKKMFIEDLKGENNELRRKEQILKSIPDLIVVFDSSGTMSFVSQSVSRFLDYSSDELESTSFWDRLTGDSVRQIKAAFMDAMAVKRDASEDSTPLSSGESVPVRLVDRDGNEGGGRLVSLKGVVHFAGDSPECVCSIRLVDEGKTGTKQSRTVSSALAQAQHERASVSAPSHQISDVESDKSMP